MNQHLDKNTATEPRPATPETLDGDASLDEEIHPASKRAPCPRNPRTIFLTGATGYLGAHLLRELLARTDARVLCLARGATHEAARDRLTAALRRNGLSEDFEPDRLVPVLGDLAQEKLGLSSAAYQRISEKADAIYHSGAFVNHTQPYRMLKDANVKGTEEILRLGCLGKGKTVHYVSTLSVLSARAYRDDDEIDEDAPLRPLLDVSSGYSQSKWVAEKLALAARDRGLAVSIYRPSLVGSHSETGRIVSDEYYFPGFVRACILTKRFPREYLDSTTNVVPVDFVAKAIAGISLDPGFQNRTFHLCHLESLRGGEAFSLIEERGYSLEAVWLFEWIKSLKALLKATMDESLLRLYPMFAAEADRREVRKNRGIEELPMPRFGRRNADLALASSGLTFPSQRESMGKMLSFLVEAGYFPRPGEVDASCGRRWRALE